jgi:glycosyltransferase involved in cell wall biosynthesis
MRVLIVVPCFGTFGGLEGFVFELANYLVKQQIDVTVCLKKVKGQFALDETLEEYIANCTASTVFVERASPELFRLIRSADLVHGQNPSIDVAVFAKLVRKPFVMTLHGWLRKPWSVRGLLARLANRLADRRWYNSDFVWGKWESENKRSTSGKLPIVSDLPSGFVDPAERKGFVFAARWIENKGLEVLLKAYAQANLDRQEWPLVLLGDGPLRPRVEALIRDLGVEGVDVRGFVDQDTRDEVMRNAKWMVTPPHTDEDLGLTPIEARHVGVPCIITRDGGLPEAGGRHALVCEPRDVNGLAAQLEKAASMKEAAYRRQSEATHEELLDYLKPLSLYLENYREVLHEKGASLESQSQVA